jgi:hypothetical protein
MEGEGEVDTPIKKGIHDYVFIAVTRGEGKS